MNFFRAAIIRVYNSYRNIYSFKNTHRSNRKHAYHWLSLPPSSSLQYPHPYYTCSILTVFSHPALSGPQILAASTCYYDKYQLLEIYKKKIQFFST